MTLMLLQSELRRILLRTWSYRLDALGDLVLWAVAFPLMMLIFDSVANGYGDERRLASLIGFLVWDLAMGALTANVQEIEQESREGTLESLVLAPVPPVWLFSLRFAARLAIQGIRTALLGLVLLLVLGLPPLFNGPALVVLALTLLGVWGISLALTGLGLVVKQLSGLLGVISLLAVLATGALVPLDSLGSLFTLLKPTVPTAWGIDALRQTLLQGASWQDLWANATLPGLAIQAAAYGISGILILRWGWRRARTWGSLAAY